jgi:hypothetical protein
MNTITTAVPLWVSVLFLMTIPIPIAMIARLVKQGAVNADFTKSKSVQLYWIVIVFFSLFLCYASVMSLTGIFLKSSIPPRVVLYTTIPLMLFLAIVVSNLKMYKTILHNIPLESLVKIHIFRLIGSFFLIINAFGAIPTAFAYMAGLGDITVALASILVAKAIVNKKPYWKSLTIAWNIFGILDIISVLVSAIVTTRMAMATGTQGVIEISKFPFSLIPSFAAATILFLHVSIFRKLKSYKSVFSNK